MHREKGVNTYAQTDRQTSKFISMHKYNYTAIELDTLKNDGMMHDTKLQGIMTQQQLLSTMIVDECPVCDDLTTCQQQETSPEMVPYPKKI